MTTLLNKPKTNQRINPPSESAAIFQILLVIAAFSCLLLILAMLMHVMDALPQLLTAPVSLSPW